MVETVAQSPGRASVNLRVTEGAQPFRSKSGSRGTVASCSIFQPCNHAQARSHVLRDSGAVLCCVSWDALNAACVQALKQKMFAVSFRENKVIEDSFRAIQYGRTLILLPDRYVPHFLLSFITLTLA